MILDRNTELVAFLDCLAGIDPPEGFLLIDIDDTAWFDWLLRYANKPVYLVEADQDRCNAMVQRLSGIEPKWQIHHQLFWRQKGPLDYHKTNLKYVDGPLNPASIGDLWSHLESIEIVTEEAQTLDGWIGQVPGASQCDWLLVGNLYAKALLQGGQNTLATINLVVVVVPKEAKADSEVVTDEKAVDEFFQGQGFRCVGAFDAAHPKLVLQAYLRYWRGFAKQFTIERDEQKQLAEQRQDQIEQLSKERDEQMQLAERRNCQLQTLTTSNQELEQRQQLFREEMLRAESQIELIKDMLLRDQES